MRMAGDIIVPLNNDICVNNTIRNNKVPADPNWLLQSAILVLAFALGFVCLVRNTVFRYFTELDSEYDRRAMTATASAMEASPSGGGDSCAVCNLATKKQCSRCKMVKYCSDACQRSHWNSEHKGKCKDIRTAERSPASTMRQWKASLSPALGSAMSTKQLSKVLFPYGEFVNLFNWEAPGFPPCGLLNCGNSCFANVVLQCLTYTRPLVAYLLNTGHKRKCRRNAWCFLCELEIHVERSTRSSVPFSPINILSRLPNIGGNLGHGQQEDAHEFMRFAIDTMQSVCLDEFGGEKSVHPKFQETTLIQHIFGGCLQVTCTECNNISNQFENMMDLTVEINGEAGSLEECLDLFTVKEGLHGDNMYKCDSCNAYVMAWKRLTIHRPPNILTIALKRFQSGRFGKLNKKVTFPETFDLSPYMSDEEEGQNTYELYAVIVHMDMLNASFFGHYICYVKDFSGSWYRVDDCEVARTDVNEVLLQGAYMLMYKRVSARPTSLVTSEYLSGEKKEKPKVEGTNSSLIQSANGPSAIPTIDDTKVAVYSEEEALPICNGEISPSVHREVSSSAVEEPSPDCNGENASQSTSDPSNDFTRTSDCEYSGVEESCTLDGAIENIYEAPSEAKHESSVPKVSNLVNGSTSLANTSKETVKKCSVAKQKPLFASGFLDKGNQANKNGQTNSRGKLPENGLIAER